MIGRLICYSVALVAIGLLSYGAWLAYEPAGFITAGLLLLLPAFFVGYNLERSQRDEEPR